MYVTQGEIPKVGRFIAPPPGIMMQSEGNLLRKGGVWVEVSLLDDTAGYAAYLRARRGLVNAADNTLPFFIDFGWQLAQDWNNPFLTRGDKIKRAVISGGIGWGASLLVGAIIAPEVTVPYLIASVVVGLTIESWSRDYAINIIAPEHRNLQPLDGE
jgi:hypothetical protein